MKAKFIYEKFSEESDPVQDMGVGMLAQIEDYLKKEGKRVNIVHNRTNANIALDLFKDNAKYEYFKFLIENPDLFDIEPDDLITSLQIAAIHQNWKFGKLLMKNGVDIDKAIEDANNRGLRTSVDRLEFLRDTSDIISIDEKFEEDSDPIRDMGIGIKEQIIRWLKNMEKEHPSYATGGMVKPLFFESDGLMYAAGYGKTNYVKYFLENYSLEYFKNNSDIWLNALPWAAERGYYKIVKMLLDFGFDPSVLNNYALRYTENKHPNIAKLLLKDPRVIAEKKKQEEKM